jgi:hypothetical protein
MPTFEPFAGPAVGEFISNPAGKSFCTAASGTLKANMVRTVKSVLESFSLS